MLWLYYRIDWASAKQLLGDTNFLKRLYEYDKDNIPDSLTRKLKKYIDNPKFTPESVEKVSKVNKNFDPKIIFWSSKPIIWEDYFNYFILLRYVVYISSYLKCYDSAVYYEIIFYVFILTGLQIYVHVGQSYRSLRSSVQNSGTQETEVNSLYWWLTLISFTLDWKYVYENNELYGCLTYQLFDNDIAAKKKKDPQQSVKD